ncbi:hypothetical protein ACI0X9_003280 [Cronobacter turicensis]
MDSFRSWLSLMVYRFTASSKELSMARDDRKMMNRIRREFNEIERRMRLYERKGGSCSEFGGSGVPTELMGFKLFAFRPEGKNTFHCPKRSGESAVVSLSEYRRR